jgi:hypothetical protein
MADEYCPICNHELPRPYIHEIRGWSMCRIHEPYLRINRYVGKCSECSETIDVGEEVLMYKYGKDAPWKMLHQRRFCKGKPK